MARPAFVFLDFDGVIMDSMSLKLDSYCHALAPFGFPREDIRRLQLASAGLSRFKTIPYMYEGITGRPMPEDQYRESLERFNVHDEASRARMVLKPGTQTFLETARSQGILLAIVTGTPQEVIDRTADHFDLRRWFARIHGSPGGKTEHLLHLLGEYGLEAGRGFYVGDAVMDQEAAAAAGIPFIGVNNGDDPFRPQGLIAEIESLDRIPELWS